jgi:hypothetical protein
MATSADALGRRLDARLRESPLKEVETNVEYSQAVLVWTSVVTLQ